MIDFRQARTEPDCVKVGRSPGQPLVSLDFSFCLKKMDLPDQFLAQPQGFTAKKRRAQMPKETSPHLQDVAILTRAVENVFRKLIRFLVGRISLVKLQEMIRIIFIEEAENQIRLQHPNKSVSLTQLGVMSGLDTRTLTKVRNSETYRKPFHATTSFLSEITPGVNVVDNWTSKPPYFNKESGKPNNLKISGEKKSFESLFYETVKSRGITVNSLLDRLVDGGTVILDNKKGIVSLTRSAYMASSATDESGAVAVGFTAIGNLIDTVVHNLSSSASKEDLFYQQTLWTYRLPISKKKFINAELRKLLNSFYERAHKFIARHEEPMPRKDQITAGVSFYYFEDVE